MKTNNNFSDISNIGQGVPWDSVLRLPVLNVDMINLFFSKAMIIIL